MKRFLFISLLMSVMTFSAFGTNGLDSIRMTKVHRIWSDDTLYFATLPEVEIFSTAQFTAEEKKQYDRLVYHVRKVYPYARLAKIKLQEYQPILDTLKSDRQRKKYMKKIEDELWEMYSGEIKRLTKTQGNILIKLIDRETQRSGFILLQDFRGKIRAFFYQGFAKLWGLNLKEEYDPTGEDWMIEYIVQKIERGEL